MTILIRERFTEPNVTSVPWGGGGSRPRARVTQSPKWGNNSDGRYQDIDSECSMKTGGVQLWLANEEGLYTRAHHQRSAWFGNWLVVVINETTIVPRAQY